MFKKKSNNNPYGIKLKFFKQQYAIDALITKRKIETEGHTYSNLKDPVLFRGDTRGPDTIFITGFYRRIEDTRYRKAKITENIESLYCISTSKKLVHSVGFADCPSVTQGSYNPKPKEKYGWVYMIHAEKGFDLTLIDNKKNMALYVEEVALTGVPPECIIAGFKIKTTKNKIAHYCGTKDDTEIHKSTKQWQILILDFKINKQCALKESNYCLYKTLIKHFTTSIANGYFLIPWSPLEEKDFALTYSLTPLQKKAYRLGKELSIEDAKKITRHDQVLCLKLGYSLEEVLSMYPAVMENLNNVSIKTLLQTNIKKIKEIEEKNVTNTTLILNKL